MCRAGGRRCPGQHSQAYINARNARRRAIYAAKKNGEPVDSIPGVQTYLEKEQEAFAQFESSSSADSESPLVEPEKKPMGAQGGVKGSGGGGGAHYVGPSGAYPKDPVKPKSSKPQKSAEPSSDNSSIIEEESVPFRSVDCSEVYGGKTLNFTDRRTGEDAEISGNLISTDSVSTKDPVSGLRIAKNSGGLVDMGYASPVSMKGLFDYTKLSEMDETKFGFMPMDTSDYTAARSNALSEQSMAEISKLELARMSKSEIHAMSIFTGDGYEGINESLYHRKKTLLAEPARTDLSEEDRIRMIDEHGGFVSNHEDFELVCKNIDSAMEKAPKVNKVVYRGVSCTSSTISQAGGDVDQWIADNYQPGSEVIMDGYQSSSSNSLQALNFAGSSNGVLFEISTPEGVNITSESAYENEQEVILPRGARYVVASVNKVDKMRPSEDSKTSFYTGTTVVRLIAVNSKGEVLDGTNSDPVKPLTEDYWRLKTTDWVERRREEEELDL